MFRDGLSYVADPRQVMFTGDERKTVQGVLDGQFEIGMARTDQIERHEDANGEPIDPGKQFRRTLSLSPWSPLTSVHRPLQGHPSPDSCVG